MTNNLKIEVMVSNIPEDGSIASQFPSQEYVNQQLAKKANLSPEGRLDPSHAPDYTEIPGLYEHIEDTKDAIETSIADSLQDAKGYTNQQLSTGLQTKADLVNGKIPFDQIPFSADIEDRIQINVENNSAQIAINTTVDANGFIKAASPIVKLFSDHIELNDEAQQQNIEFEKLGVGDYLIKGGTGFAQEGWYIETPKDANGNALFSVVYTTLESGDISVKTYKKKFCVETASIVADLAYPVDITVGRWIDLRLNEANVK